MNTIITTYIFAFLAVAAYVAINIFHLIRFRIGFRGDKTGVAIVIYLIFIIAIITLSWLGGIIAYQDLMSQSLTT